MIGKGKFFDIISRTSDDVNNMDITIYDMLENYRAREYKFNKEISKDTNF